jgi:hypothetical protein
MRRKTKYFSRDGRELSEAEALDANGIMRSGVIARHQQFADGRALFDSGQLVVTDFDSTGSSGNRPGWRCSDSPIHRQAMNDARAAYLHDLQTAYKNPSEFGERGMIGQREGDLCTIDGRAGRLRSVNGQLRCVLPDRGTGEMPDADDDVDTASDRRTVDHRTVDRRTVDQISAEHQQKMSVLLADHAAWLSQQWRTGK